MLIVDEISNLIKHASFHTITSTECWYIDNHTLFISKYLNFIGGNTGIGYETALDLGKRGAIIIMGCRNIKWDCHKEFVQHIKSF